MNEKLLEKSENTKVFTVEDMIEKSIPDIAKMMDEGAAKRFARIILTNMRMNPELAQCSSLSLMGAIFTAAELKLEPVAGRAYILPFNNRKKVGNDWITVKEAQFILGYKGLVDLFYRHASAINLSWGVVHENDEFDFYKGSENYLKHKQSLGDRGGKIAYWVGANVNGQFNFEVMTHEDCIQHGKDHSKTFDKKKGAFYKSSPWVTATDSMCKKTVLMQLSKVLPLSVEAQKAIQSDETTKIIHPQEIQRGELTALEAPDETDWSEGENDV